MQGTFLGAHRHWFIYSSPQLCESGVRKQTKRGDLGSYSSSGLLSLPSCMPGHYQVQRSCGRNKHRVCEELTGWRQRVSRDLYGTRQGV